MHVLIMAIYVVGMLTSAIYHKDSQITESNRWHKNSAVTVCIRWLFVFFVDATLASRNGSENVQNISSDIHYPGAVKCGTMRQCPR